MAAEFKVGKRVIAITQSDRWNKYDVFPLLGIKKNNCCCGSRTLLMIGDFGVNTCCSKCNTKTGGSWYDSRNFAPYEGDELSRLTDSDILHSEEILTLKS